ncbi:MAG: hypothetical protein V7L20_00635 [Nostoc sp.]|uniref:hypothetical protein n=1 Tax=Nostoc sp. TaxID=1180 RepID=UPI002FF51C35
MFELNDLRQTRFFQDVFEEAKQEGKREVFEEAKQEGKLEVIPHLLAFGFSIEQIAQALGLDNKLLGKLHNQNLKTTDIYLTEHKTLRPYIFLFLAQLLHKNLMVKNTHHLTQINN